MCATISTTTIITITIITIIIAIIAIIEEWHGAQRSVDDETTKHGIAAVALVATGACS